MANSISAIMAIDAAEQIEKFQEFVEQSYQKQLHENLSKGLNFLVLDFFELTKFDPKLADQLLEEPEETLKAAEMALEQFDVKKGFRVRFKNLPKSQEVYIRNLRSKHLNKFIAMEGIIRQSSEVRPQAVSAKFECPSCGNTITMPQIDVNFREPSRCSCGRKGKFRLLSKELIDVQRIVIEESPENLEGGAQPKRMQIFLREDLVEPRMEKRTTPGTRIITNGVMFELPIPTKTGGTSTRFDLGVNGNFVEPVEEDYSEISITPEDEAEIKKLAKDKDIYKRIIASIAPSIYGHDRIKEAIMLQLFGGIRKVKADQTVVRGDLHVLLVGDPGCIAGDSQVAVYNKGFERIDNLGKRHLEELNLKLANINGKGFDYAKKFHKYEQKLVLKVVTESGKELICTLDHPLLTKEGWKRADCLMLGEQIRVVPKIENLNKKYVKTNFKFVKKSSGALKEVKLPEYLTPELAGLYGYIIGDGNLHPKGYRITCYVADAERELILPITNLWKETFNIEPYYSVRSPRVSMIQNVDGSLRQVQSSQKIHLIEANSKHVAQVLSFLAEKRVPQSIFESPLNVVVSFLKWLFEADGCAFGNGRGRTSIQLKSRSEKLLRDVQLLLLYFGIHSRIVEDNLCIRRANDMQLFIENIGFVSEKKNNALLKVKEVIDSRKRKWNVQEWEKIVSINFVGVKDVYDFEVPESNLFIANGIVLHNCGKSQMLTFVEKTAPKSRYVAGRSASGAGLCVSPNSLIMTNKGLVKIKDLVENHLKNNSIKYTDNVWIAKKIDTDYKIFTYDSSRIFEKTINQFWRIKAPDRLLKLRTQSGKEIILTLNTKLLRKNNLWIESEKLIIGDSIGIVDVHMNFLFDKIISKKLVKPDYDYVYDLTVADSHNFVVDGVLVHNTASVVKDEFLRGWALEAGAMVLADKGILVLDEMDKISKEDTSALHEAMEQQSLSIAKANIQAKLRTQTSILAAANPKLGRFDPYTPIPNQIDLPPALINRFDLIFVMRDLPNKEVDANIASKVLQSHSYKDSPPEIDGKVLRKYLAYTKQRIFPKLTEEAIEVIRKYYVDLRSSGSEGDSTIKPIPISARQLEAVVRLAEASARIKLKETVDEDDALRAIALLKGCMNEIGIDPDTGKVDIDRMTTGISASARGRIIDVREVLFQLSEEKMGGPISIEDDLKPKVFEKGITERKLEEAIEALKKNGDFFEPKKGWIQKI
jgi:DNA replicative helicase MCM subunit Mcm2 (Cdc46/Mcm family)